MIEEDTLYGFGGHVDSTWALHTRAGVLGACMLDNATGRAYNNPEQLRNRPRTATVFEQSDSAEVANMIWYSLERTCCIVLEVTMTRHGPWKYVGKCWVHACP
jgi:hypothetical protein